MLDIIMFGQISTMGIRMIRLLVIILLISLVLILKLLGLRRNLNLRIDDGEAEKVLDLDPIGYHNDALANFFGARTTFYA